MSTSFHIVIQSKVSENDIKQVEVYNWLYKNNIVIPIDLEANICRSFGDAIIENGLIELPGNNIIELPIKPEGNIYENGLIISLDNLPENATAIRIYTT